MNQLMFSKKKKKSKVAVSYETWLDIVTTLIKKHAKAFKFFAKLKSLTGQDADKPLCIEMLKRFDKEKLTLDDAIYLMQTSADQVAPLQQQTTSLMIIYVVSMIILAITSVIFFMRVPHTMQWSAWASDYSWAMWGVIWLASVILFARAHLQKDKFEQDFLKHMLITQVSSAYAVSKSPGKGGSLQEAIHQLGLLKAQIRAQSPISQFAAGDNMKGVRDFFARFGLGKKKNKPGK